MDKKTVGTLGEEAACRYLEAQGHRILERNWRSGHLELDIVSMDGAGLHFVEVKTRVAPLTAAPEESVRQDKRRRMVGAANAYLNDSKTLHGNAQEIFFDVVSVVLDGEKRHIEYFPQAFIPIYV
ncbi:MAG: YraN family protein [Bacteroidales bacterium]|nr:YraN family protein [Bacteroidales bacterium]